VDAELGGAGLAMTVLLRDPRGLRHALPPIRLPDEEEAALADAIAFLERWGFIRVVHG
jgi:hypothetical protein